jgi:hypothetical protein
MSGELVPMIRESNVTCAAVRASFVEECEWMMDNDAWI